MLRLLVVEPEGVLRVARRVVLRECAARRSCSTPTRPRALRRPGSPFAVSDARMSRMRLRYRVQPPDQALASRQRDVDGTRFQLGDRRPASNSSTRSASAASSSCARAFARGADRRVAPRSAARRGRAAPASRHPGGRGRPGARPRAIRRRWPRPVRRARLLPEFLEIDVNRPRRDRAAGCEMRWAFNRIIVSPASPVNANRPFRRPQSAAGLACAKRTAGLVEQLVDVGGGHDLQPRSWPRPLNTKPPPGIAATPIGREPSDGFQVLTGPRSVEQHQQPLGRLAGQHAAVAEDGQ